MNWRFWRRRIEKSPRGREESAAVLSKRVNTVKEHLPNVNGLQMSNRELLGLQRIIGNRAVIQMLRSKE